MISSPDLGRGRRPSLPRFRPAARVGPMLRTRPSAAPPATAGEWAHHRLRRQRLRPAGTGPAVGCPAPAKSWSRPEAVAASLPACRAGRADVASPAVGSAAGHGQRVGSPPPAPSVTPSSRHRARRPLLNRFRLWPLAPPRLASGVKSLHIHPAQRTRSVATPNRPVSSANGRYPPGLNGYPLLPDLPGCRGC